MSTLSLQETYAPENTCFGCGPANAQGLGIRSFVDGDGLVADWTPQTHHEAFPGVLNGGIIGALLDCHCNWAAAWHLMQTGQLDKPPCTVTMEYAIKLRRPTPSDRPVHLHARAIESDGKTVRVEGSLWSNGKLCDQCIGKFVAVEPGHPAYHRW